MLPCLMLSLLDLLVFCLPPESGEKVSLGITVLLSFSVFLLVIADNVPQTSETAPLLGTWFLGLIHEQENSVFGCSFYSEALLKDPLPE